MKIVLIIILTILVTLFSPVAQANTYPPGNAAVIYYKIFYDYPPDSEVMDKIDEYSRGNIELDEEISKHLDRFQYVMKELTVASNIAYCNWGIDFSKGYAARVVGFSNFKKYTFLLLSDARRLASNGDYYEAIDRCVTVEKFAVHLGSSTLINSLMGISVSSLADRCLMHIFSQENVDIDVLKTLYMRVNNYSSRIGRIKVGLLNENKFFEVMFSNNSPNKLTYETLISDTDFDEPKEENVYNGVDKEMMNKVKGGDPDFFNETLKYYTSLIYSTAAVFDQPYKQAMETLSKEIDVKIEKDAKEKPEALLALSYMPAYSKCYQLAVRSQNSLNALKTGLEIMIAKAETRKLPEKLPADTPKDLYTGKEIVYEITDDGFILRCQGPDTKRDKKKDTYIFKIKK